MKKVLKIAAIALLAVLAVVLLYVGYVFGTYSRIEDNQQLTVTQGSGGTQTAEADTEYKVLCWNIGFGAYEDDFGFFMDGGTESRAWSKERVTANIYSFNTQSRNMFLSLGFRETGREWFALEL